MLLVRRTSLICDFAMPRKGWTAMEIPSKWVQVLRGPRPKSKKWPVVSSGRKQPTSNQQEPHRGRWRQPVPQRSNVRAPDPDAVLGHARSKSPVWRRFWPPWAVIKESMPSAAPTKKAKQAAQERPLKMQFPRHMRSWRGRVSASRSWR